MEQRERTEVGEGVAPHCQQQQQQQCDTTMKHRHRTAPTRTQLIAQAPQSRRKNE